MTVASELNRKSFAGDDATVAFPTTPVVFFDEGDLDVYVVVTATGVATLQTLTTHYTVSGGDGAVGTVTMLTAPTSLQTLVIVRTLDILQEVDFVQNDTSDVEVAEDAIDRLTMISQQLDTKVERSFKLPDGDISGASTEVPIPEASKVIGWNDDASALQNYSAADIEVSLVSPFMETVLDDATAAAARVTLDVFATTESFLSGTARLVRDSATVVSLGVGLIPLKVSGRWVTRTLAAAITKDNTGLSASTLYYVYAADSSGTILEFSTTAPTTDTTFGVRIKTGDATRTLVGRVVTTSASQFVNDVSVALGVVSWFNPKRYVRVDYNLFGPDTYQDIDQAGTSSVYAWPGGSLSSSTSPQLALGGGARIAYAVWSVQYQSNNIGNATRLVHFDSGPTNITEITAFATDPAPGTPVNFSVDVTSALQALQDSLTVLKGFGWQTLCVNTTALRYFSVRLIVTYDLTDPF